MPVPHPTWREKRAENRQNGSNLPFFLSSRFHLPSTVSRQNTRRNSWLVLQGLGRHVYPKHKPPGFDRLAHQLQLVDTIGVNNTFYRPPSPSVAKH